MRELSNLISVSGSAFKHSSLSLSIVSRKQTDLLDLDLSNNLISFEDSSTAHLPC
jgi:hypothetical protein